MHTRISTSTLDSMVKSHEHGLPHTLVWRHQCILSSYVIICSCGHQHKQRHDAGSRSVHKPSQVLQRAVQCHSGAKQCNRNLQRRRQHRGLGELRSSLFLLGIRSIRLVLYETEAVLTAILNKIDFTWIKLTTAAKLSTATFWVWFDVDLNWSWKQRLRGLR